MRDMAWLGKDAGDWPTKEAWSGVAAAVRE